jgi:transcription antitermination factor NusG
MKPIDLNKVWYVVRTNIKCESKASDNVRLAGFDVYYPRQRYEKKHRRTNLYTTHERPLMIGYIFVGMPAEAEQRHFGFIRACEGVERFLDYQGAPIRLRAADVQEIYLAEVDMKFDDTRAARKHRGEGINDEFPRGARIFVKEMEHIFRGFLGEVVGTDGKERVHVSLAKFGKVWFHQMEIEVAKIAA